MIQQGSTLEEQMRDEDVPWPTTVEELAEYVKGQIDREHDYGSCVYAMSTAATAALRYVAKELGVTGFQASCADMDFLRRTRGLEWGRVVDYSQLLYPQYCNDEKFPSLTHLLRANREELAKRARVKLAEEDLEHVIPGVVAHWRILADGGPA